MQYETIEQYIARGGKITIIDNSKINFFRQEEHRLAQWKKRYAGKFGGYFNREKIFEEMA